MLSAVLALSLAPLPSVRLLLLLGAAVRVALIAWGEWQDAHLPVPYTDVDYRVYSDAAALVLAGRSPYERATYRYTPLLAWLLTPTSVLPCFGKLLFSSADLLVAVLAQSLLRLQGKGTSEATVERCVAALSLFNPLSATVSTRGNADVLVLLLCLATLHCLLAGRITAAALLYGSAVHLKLYPIIYAPALVGFLLQPHGRALSASAILRCLRFCALSCASSGCLSLLCYTAYGWPFLNEAFLYHVTRADTRHNFSLYFYHLYLQASAAPIQSSLPSAAAIAAFLPQVALMLSISLLYCRRSLPFCLALQTTAFVAFNKVITAQYFLWYFGLAPLALPHSTLPRTWGAAACALWLAAELHWLAWAYQVEMLGRSRFLPLHLAAATLFLVHCACMALAVAHHQQPKSIDR